MVSANPAMDARPGPIVDVARTLDAAPVGAFQVFVAVLCGLLVFLDGYDTQLIAFIAPSIAAELHLSRPELGPLFVASLIGIMIGALSFGPLADRFGRRTVILISTAVFALACLATAGAGSLSSLLALRFVTGLGLGGAMPNAIALTAEFCPTRRRATFVMMMFTGFSLGAAAAGGLSAWLIPLYGWRSVLVVGGVLPLALLALLFFRLPESIRFLVATGAAPTRITALLLRAVPGCDAAADARYVSDEATSHGMPVAQLFRARRPLGTILLWVMFFANLLTNFTLQNWIPTLAGDRGLPIQTAALIGAMFQIGGTVASLSLGFAVDRLGAFRVVPSLFALAIPFVALLGQDGLTAGALMALTFGAGVCIVGGQNCANALAAIYYPTSVRSTGVGWALGVGRIGAIIGPIAAGQLLAGHLPVQTLFLLAAVAPACAATAGFVMAALTRSERDARPPVMAQAQASAD